LLKNTYALSTFTFLLFHFDYLETLIIILFTPLYGDLTSQIGQQLISELVLPSRRQLLASNRSVNSMHKDMICKYARADIGPSKVYHLLKEEVGGYENIGCMQKDLYNYHRDSKTLIKDTDAQMFIDVLKNKKEVDPGFFIDYQVDEENQLKYIFLLDSLNNYLMVFAPFTRLNHHSSSFAS